MFLLVWTSGWEETSDNFSLVNLKELLFFCNPASKNYCLTSEADEHLIIINNYALLHCMCFGGGRKLEKPRKLNRIL